MTTATANLPAPQVTTTDRLSFTLFLALALHGVVILGVTFNFVAAKLPRPSFEVTLAQQRSVKPPEQPDFHAQHDQLGSGSLEEKALLTTPIEAEFQDMEVRETGEPLKINQVMQEPEEAEPVTTTADQANEAAPDEPVLTPPAELYAPSDRINLERVMEIASLQARLDQQIQTYAKRPRVKRLTSLSTVSSVDAFYLNSWRRKVERIGNLNYPEEARQRKIYGSLRLMVAILPDGSLKEVELLESSGQPVLDNAAINIVRLASPFAPFPDELRRTTDVLEIIRTWQFRKNSSLRSY